MIGDTMILHIPGPAEMERLGAAIASKLRPGDLVVLGGKLGAGKTTLTRGLGAALGVAGTVSSPTFVLARTHPRGDEAPLVHVDAYRLSSPAELDDLDIDFENSIVVVEWGAGMLEGIAESWLSVDIERPRSHATTDTAMTDTAPTEDVVEPRSVTVTGVGARWRDLSWLELD